MKLLVILGHPQPGSFNHAIAQTAVETLRSLGHEVVLHDLYAEGFDPAFSAAELSPTVPLDAAIERHCAELAAADGIIVVHPNWWGQPPAVLKGWVDRVFRQGVAYRFGTNDQGEGVPIGMLKARHAIVFNTANTPMDRELEVFGDPLDNLWKRCVFDFCGVPNFHRRVFTVVIISTPEQRKQWLDEVRQLVGDCFPGGPTS
ncbi:MAG: NAD(P)H-dependent oxidoreductase [Pirellulales bacterium]